MKFRLQVFFNIMGFLLVLCCLYRASGTNPVDIFDNAVIGKPIKRPLYYPPLPLSENISARETPALSGYSSTAIRDNSSNSDWIRYCWIELGSLTDSLLGNIWANGFSMVLPSGRKENKKYPGLYLVYPQSGSKSELSAIERGALSDFLKELLQARLYSPELIDVVYQYKDVLGDSTRDEFFGRTIVDDNEISIGGWFGKFISLGIFADFNDVDSFLDKAVTSFNLPPVEKDNVAVHGKGDEFLYSLKDKENMFILRGYTVRINCEFTTGESRPNVQTAKVIELIKYFDKEFMP